MNKKNGSARQTASGGPPPTPPDGGGAIAPPGHVRSKGHGLTAPLEPATGMDKLREVLGLSQDASALEVLATAVGEIEGLRARLEEAKTAGERSNY